MSLLETKHLGVMFDGLRALEGVNFQLEENQIMGLIGPNGISKTTVFNLLTQVYQPMEGTIELEGKSIIDKKTYDMTRGGITRIFQNIRLFKDISILGNVRIAMSHQMKHSALAGILRLPSYWKEEHAMTERAMDLLSAFNL